MISTRGKHAFLVLVIAAGTTGGWILSCAHRPSAPLGYGEGLEWGKRFSAQVEKDYSVVKHVRENVFKSKRDGFRVGFIQAYADQQEGEEMIDTLLEAAGSEEFEQGFSAGEKLRKGKITDILVRDHIVRNHIKSKGKRAGWRIGFIIGYEGGGEATYEQGEAIYMSLESSTMGVE